MKNVYLDYSATTPVDNDVLNEYFNSIKRYIANPNSIHIFGNFARNYLQESTTKISNILKCKEEELIFTSCASESNSTVFRGLEKNYSNKKHIIISHLEHKSILDEAKRLEEIGYCISYVKLKDNGQVDLESLKELLSKDTILVSICGVNSESGYVQDLKSIKEVIDSYDKSIFFHSDLTQALGKIKIDLSILDAASFSSHKIYSPKGIGLLYKNERFKLDNLIGGTTKNTPLRGGTPSIHLIGAFAFSLSRIYANIDDNYYYVKKLNEKLLEGLKKYDIRINSNEYSIPHIVNISLLNCKSTDFVRKMSLCGISISTNSACCSRSHSILLEELTHDEKIYSTSIRISLSHLTSYDDIDYFLKEFDKILKNLAI